MQTNFWSRTLVLFATSLLLGATARAGEDEQKTDPYEQYVKTAPEFRAVKTIRSKAWDTWLYMPWRHKWIIGTNDDAGRFCKEHGIHGGFLDHGRGPLKWLEKHNLRFYVDHVAGKGTLYLKDKPGDKPPTHRPVPLDENTLEQARQLVLNNLSAVKNSPQRIAYALDDEISWSSFLRPLPWRLHEHDEWYTNWLRNYYGTKDVRPLYVTPDFTRSQLDRQVKDIDFSPLLDRLTYQDSHFAKFVQKLVETANEQDPETPCGFVGAQAPNAWGGYDYAKLAKSVQFIEAYDNGSAPEIVRSLSNATVVSTHFRSDRAEENTWQAWRHFAHGQRGMIAWVGDGWFDGWLDGFQQTLKEIGEVQGPKTNGASWQHDRIAIYYSHPSIQVSWCLDAEPHGWTWRKRNNDARIGTSHTVRKAWETLLNDEGLQYDFLAYDEVIRKGVPTRYKTLILPACYALSDAEAKKITEFAKNGGTVIADFSCGLFDPHGKGRTKGALDDLFGTAHDGTETKRDFFGKHLWVEADQDKGHDAQRWKDLLGEIPGKERSGSAVAENRLEGPYVRQVGKGRAVYLNLSPLRYLKMREEGSATHKNRAPFVEHLGVKPDVEVKGERNIEVTRWQKGDRMLLFVVQNPVLHASGKREVLGGETTIEIRFAQGVRDVVNERTGEGLGEGDRFTLKFARAEAVFLSYR